MPSSQSASRRLFFCLLAIVLGFVGAGVAKLLLAGINFCTNLFYFHTISLAPAMPSANTLGGWSIWVPALGGIIVGLMARYGSDAIRGHGIPEAMEKILNNDSRIPKRVALLKPLSAAIAIGSGGPFGAEGPIIATGGAIGSIFGQMFPTTAAERKMLLACGAAAGMTAIFGTPLASMLLAIELLLFEFRPLSFIPVGISAAVATSLHMVFFDSKPFFVMPDFLEPTTFGFFLYMLSGLYFGVIAVFVTKLVYYIEDAFEHIRLHWMWWPAVGGLVVGVVGLVSPDTLGVGYGNIENALALKISLGAAVSLGFWKLISWAVALGSGTSGGTLAPLLTIGSLSGLVLGVLVQRFFPDSGLDPHIFALIGMAAVFAGSSRALLASLIFALESTRQPIGVVPLLGACSIAYLISHSLMKNTIMTEKIARRGTNVPHEYFPTEP